MWPSCFSLCFLSVCVQVITKTYKFIKYVEGAGLESRKSWFGSAKIPSYWWFKPCSIPVTVMSWMFRWWSEELSYLEPDPQRQTDKPVLVQSCFIFRWKRHMNWTGVAGRASGGSVRERTEAQWVLGLSVTMILVIGEGGEAHEVQRWIGKEWCDEPARILQAESWFDEEQVWIKQWQTFPIYQWLLMIFFRGTEEGRVY